MKDTFLESDFLSAKRVAVFSVNRVQSIPTVDHINQIDKLYNTFIDQGIDDVYCVSFCDFPFFNFLMPKYSDKIKFIQELDTLTQFQRILNKRGHPDFLKQYWQFATVINHGLVECYIEQPFNKQKIHPDTKEKIYSAVSPEILLTQLTNKSV